MDRVDRRALVPAAAVVFAVSVSVAAVGIGLPVIAVDVGASQAEVTRISAATSIAFVAALLPAGAATRRHGQRRVLAGGLALLALAELATAAAGSPDVIAALRVVSGLGAACVLPVLLVRIVDAFPRERRATAVTVWAVVSSVGASLGGVGAGLLLDVTSWRVLPLLVAGTVALLAPVVVRVVPADPDPDEPVDLLGALLVVVGLGSGILGLTLLGGADVPLGSVAAALAVGIVALAAFARRLRRSPDPLLPVAVLRGNRALQSGAALVLGGSAAFGGYVLLGPQFVQFVLGASPLQTSLLFLVGDAGLLAIAPFLPRLIRTVGLVPVGCAGLLVVGACLLTLAALGGTSLVAVALVFAPLGVGIAAATTCAAELIVSSVEDDDRSVATAANYLGRDLGTALGGAVVGTVLAFAYRASVADGIDGVSAVQAEQVRSGFPGALEVAGELPGERAEALTRAASLAFTDAYQYALSTAAGLALLAAAVAWWRGRGGGAARCGEAAAARSGEPSVS